MMGAVYSGGVAGAIATIARQEGVAALFSGKMGQQGWGRAQVHESANNACRTCFVACATCAAYVCHVHQ